MGVAYAAERGLLAEDEIGPIEHSHFPLLGEIPRTELQDLARWLRGRRGRARDIIHDRRRVRRGKTAARGTASENASERGLSAKKQVFARALRRVNARLDLLLAEEKRALNAAKLRAALARKQDHVAQYPEAGPGARGGMQPKANRQRPMIIQPGRIGSVSQAGQRAQARRDARG